MPRLHLTRNVIIIIIIIIIITIIIIIIIIIIINQFVTRQMPVSQILRRVIVVPI